MCSPRWIVFISISFIVSSCAPSFDPSEYFPLETNNIYYYSGSIYILKVVGKEEIGDALIWKIHYIDSSGAVYLVEEYVPDPQTGPRLKSFAVRSVPRIVFTPPTPMVPPSLEVGMRDTVSGTEAWGKDTRVRFKRIRIVESIEDIVVPAGKFSDCVQVRYEHIYARRPPLGIFGTTRFWLAKDVGIVKYEFIDQALAGELQRATVGDKSYPH